MSIGHDLAIKFPVASSLTVPLIARNKQCSFRFVGIREVQSVIRGLKNNKSTCVNHMSMTILKDAMTMLVVEFTQLINECLDKSIMPL